MANPNRIPLHPRAAWLFAGVFGVLVLASAGTGAATVIQDVALLAAMATMVYGVRRNGADDLTTWKILLTVGATYLVAGTLRAFGPAGGLLGYLPDLFSVAGYVLLWLAVCRMLRLRGRLSNAGDFLDMGLVGCSLTICAWVFIIEPSLAASDAPAVTKILNALYPVISIFVLFMAGLLSFSGGRHRPALTLLSGGFVAMTVGDVLFAAASIGVNVPLSLAPAMYVLTLVAIAAASLHPSMRVLTRAERTPSKSIGAARLTFVASALAVPLITYVGYRPDSGAALAVVACVTGVMGAIVIVRMISSIKLYSTMQQQLTWQATHDALTSLPNRTLLESRLEDLLLERERALAVLFFDLDRFKNVNDTWGHAIGDELLVQVAERIQSGLREHDVIARVSGDEFVLVCPHVANPQAAAGIGRRILEQFTDAYQLSAVSVTVTPSIGVTWAGSDRDVTADDLLREADSAMYRSKAAGRKTVTLYDGDIAAEAARRVMLEEHLRVAVDRGELTMVYQPIVSPGTGRILGFEALMRWSHPQLGTVSPAEFIPLAEESGQIVQIGRWSLQQSVAQLARWHRHDPSLTVSVNLSTRQLRDEGLTDFVHLTIAEHGVDPHTLFLEVTETAMLSDADQADIVFAALKSIGVRLSIDDFGTGYSSMSFLRRYPIDQVKIDRSFVAGLGESRDDEAICRSVVILAQSMGLHLVGEGVETPGQRDGLVGLGCEKAQGWLFSKPLTGDDCVTLLAGGTLTLGPGRQQVAAG
jgi:diguanylate cyclase (GGDEF)-like protein